MTAARLLYIGRLVASIFAALALLAGAVIFIVRGLDRILYKPC